MTNYYISGVNDTISEAELEVFKLRPEYESLVELYKNTEGIQAPDFNSDTVLSEILASPKQQTKVLPLESNNRKATGLLSWLKYGVAASLLMGAFYFLSPLNNEIVHHVTEHEILEGDLPDASTFTLNAGSDLSYDLDNWSNKRTLTLSGEAFFKVEKGSKFEVITSNGKIQVLGTQFNVRSLLGGLEVVCTEGVVLVVAKDGEVSERLTAEQAIKIRPNGEVVLWTDDGESSVSWMSGITRLKDVTLQEVIIALEKQFEIKIEISGLELNERLSCSFQHEELELALKTATAPLKLKWEISDNTVRLFK